MGGALLPGGLVIGPWQQEQAGGRAPYSPILVCGLPTPPLRGAWYSLRNRIFTGRQKEVCKLAVLSLLGHHLTEPQFPRLCKGITPTSEGCEAEVSLWGGQQERGQTCV